MAQFVFKFFYTYEFVHSRVGFKSILVVSGMKVQKFFDETSLEHRIDPATQTFVQNFLKKKNHTKLGLSFEGMKKNRNFGWIVEGFPELQVCLEHEAKKFNSVLEKWWYLG